MTTSCVVVSSIRPPRLARYVAARKYLVERVRNTGISKQAREMTTKVTAASYLDFYSTQPLVAENEFIKQKPDRSSPPSLHDPAVRSKLPDPFWEGARGRDWLLLESLGDRVFKPASGSYRK